MPNDIGILRTRSKRAIPGSLSDLQCFAAESFGNHLNMSIIAQCQVKNENMDRFMDDFIRYLRRIVNVPEPILRKILNEVNDYYLLTVDEFVQKRHVELRHQGKYKNEDIYRIIQEEVESRRFPRELTIRQIRRIIYG